MHELIISKFIIMWSNFNLSLDYYYIINMNLEITIHYYEVSHRQKTQSTEGARGGNTEVSGRKTTNTKNLSIRPFKGCSI